jgi:hypothetical protein
MPEQTWATEICWAVSNLKKTENGMALVIFGTWYLFSQGKGNKNHFSTLHTESSYKNTTTTPSHASVVASSNCRFQDSKAELDLSKIYFSFTLSH